MMHVIIKKFNLAKLLTQFLKMETSNKYFISYIMVNHTKYSVTSNCEIFSF